MKWEKERKTKVAEWKLSWGSRGCRCWRSTKHRDKTGLCNNNISFFVFRKQTDSVSTAFGWTVNRMVYSESVHKYFTFCGSSHEATKNAYNSFVVSVCFMMMYKQR